MNTNQTAKAIRDFLIAQGVIAVDSRKIRVKDIEKILIDAQPTAKQKYLDKAGEFLCGDAEEIETMVKAIVAHEDEHDLIDYIDGVDVWEKVQFSFTCEQFLEQIGYVEK